MQESGMMKQANEGNQNKGLQLHAKQGSDKDFILDRYIEENKDYVDCDYTQVPQNDNYDYNNYQTNEFNRQDVQADVHNDPHFEAHNTPLLNNHSVQ